MGQFFLLTLALAALAGLFGLALVPVGMSLATDMAVACTAAVTLLALLPGRAFRFFFVTLCAWVVVRYIAWRFQSLPLDEGIVTALGALALLGAECYGAAMLLLGLFVNAWPLEREPTPLPADTARWPTVDIYVPTYSEPTAVVAPTVMAALEVDYPRDKLNVYVLDDGWPRAQNPGTPPETARELAQRTVQLQAMCVRHGATWLARERNEHAKSGNMNAALARTQGELILVLDADHVPTRDILANTAGLFVDNPKMAFVQTPHFFQNSDPVERNLSLLNRMPGESDMFYRVVQKGLDLWNTSFFCGSAAVLRREAIVDVGGFSVDSITEDASTSVKMHQRGWNSAYVGIPMVAGLQPETFAGFTVQRLRWAMGMMQILLKQNPLFVRGLALPQRLAYLSVVMFWLFPFARIVFFCAPFLSLFFNMTIYPVGLEFFYAYTVPYLVAVVMSFEKTYGKVRRILVSELYETLQAFYTLPALLATLLRPNAPTFKVTPKGEQLGHEFISELSRPFYAFYALTLAGLAWGGMRMLTEPQARSALALSVGWLFFNFVLLSGALGTLVERAQRRVRPRVRVNERATAVGEFGTRDVLLVDVNETGALVRSFDGEHLPQFSLKLDSLELPCKVLAERTSRLGRGEHAVQFEFPTARHERAAVLLGYGKSQRWLDVWRERESSANFILSAVGIVRIALRGGAKHVTRLLNAVK